MAMRDGGVVMKRRAVLLIVAALFHVAAPWSATLALAELNWTIQTVDSRGAGGELDILCP